MVDKINNDKNKIIKNYDNKDKIVKRRKRKKRKVNIKQKLAIKKYIDPKSGTFLNKSKSMQEVGYSKNYADKQSSKILDNISVTDIDLSKFDTFINDIPQLSIIIKKKLEQLLLSDDIKAKDYANIIRHVELLAKFAGIIKNITENKSINVNIDIPISKCPKCGYIMDIMKE